MKRYSHMTFGLVSVLLVVIFFGCAKLQPQIMVEGGQGTKRTIDMQADSFVFTPNNIKAVQGDIITFNITNVSGKEHNFTITDRKGRIMQSVNLPAKKTVPVTVTLSEGGGYEFFCNKPFHTFLGMKGRIEVEAHQ
jgi:plastocyanin